MHQSENLTIIDDRDVLLHENDLSEIRTSLIRFQYNPVDQIDNLINIECTFDDLVEQYHRKERALSVNTLITPFDFVFLDLNHNFESIISLADLLVIVLDLTCPHSINSAEITKNLFVHLKQKMNKDCAITGVLTNMTTSNNYTDHLAVCGVDDSNLSEKTMYDLLECDLSEYSIITENLNIAQNLDFSIFNTYLTNSYQLENDRLHMEHMKNSGEKIDFIYSHALSQISPECISAIEIKKLTNEILNYFKFGFKGMLD